jgi:hypothetical protein
MELTEKDIQEIELSISFGQRLVEYYKLMIDKISSTMMDDNQKYRQFYEADRQYVNDVIQALERGEETKYLYVIKKRLTVVGQQFFQKQFTELKKLIACSK